jgi:hypothetical protein
LASPAGGGAKSYVLEVSHAGLFASKAIGVTNGTLQLVVFMEMDLSISPNPASGLISLELTDYYEREFGKSSELSNAASRATTTYTVQVVDIATGSTVYKGEMKGSTGTLSASSFPNGIYNVIVSDGVNVCRQKLIVQH